MAITTDLSKLRLRIGDTDSTAYIFEDDELNYFLSENANDISNSALAACESAAARFARAYDFQTDGQAYKRSQMSKAFLALAADLRAQGATTSTSPDGVSSIAVTKVDGWSDDISNADVLVNTNGRSARFGRYDPDITP